MSNLQVVETYLKATYALPKPVVGYLLIKTDYFENGTKIEQKPDDQNTIDANAEVALRIGKLVHDRCGYLRGAVVAVDDNAYNIIIAVRLFQTSQDPDPLTRLAEDISDISISNSPVFNSDISVQSVSKARVEEPSIQLGFQGPP